MATLGGVLKEARETRRLSQRALAARVGVKSGHIAQCESGQRKPSLALLGRMATVLGLDGRYLLTLISPDAQALLGPESPGKPKKTAWQKFAEDHAVHAQYLITPDELAILEHISTIQEVSCSANFLFLLNAIRLAGPSRRNRPD